MTDEELGKAVRRLQRIGDVQFVTCGDWDHEIELILSYRGDGLGCEDTWRAASAGDAVAAALAALGED